MRQIRCLVVDDEPLAAKLISNYVSRTPFLSLEAEVNSAEEALAIIQQGSVDLVFLDIRMPRLSGMQLANLVSDNVKIVFTTAYADHAVEGFKVNALDYLLKPVSYEDFIRAATRALKELEATESAIAPANESQQASPDFLLVKSEYRLLRIPLSDIIYIEGLKDYVKIYIEGDTKPVLSLMSMKSLEDALAQPRFIRVHRSFIVNFDKIRLIERNSIIIAGRCIPISDSYKRRFFALLGGGNE
ncbi:MAG: response regulator transcription factor [Muribaculaceae bacterium]|nr:response regulator transcription factor [Muribaculaceae bacterium]